jgi:hypothetical protein
VGAAGGLQKYREQQQKAKLLRQLYRQQQRDRAARRAKEKARARKTRAVVRDEGQPAAQLLATQVVELLRRPGLFDRCLSSLKKSKKLLQAPAVTDLLRRHRRPRENRSLGGGHRYRKSPVSL